MEAMDSVRQMIEDRKGTKAILRTMPERELAEQNEVWTAGLGKMANEAARIANKIAGTIVERIADGFMDGLFYDPLDEAEAYIRNELRLSRARVKGEEERQTKLEDLLLAVGAARALRFENLHDYYEATGAGA